MVSFLREIRSIIMSSILQKVLIPLLLLGYGFALYLIDKITPYLFSQVSRQHIAQSMLLLLLITIFLIAFTITSHIYNYKYHKAFGVLWDKNSNPHCSSCRKLMSYEETQPTFPYYLRCPNKHKSVKLNNDDGNKLNLQQAKEIVKEQMKKS